MSRYVIGIGANLGDPVAALVAAVEAIATVPRTSLVRVSALYRTEPIGGPEQPAYANAAVLIDTGLEPSDLLAAIQAIEAAAGRVRDVHWGPRTLDLDILWRDGQPIDTRVLRVPHPRLRDRRFALEPLLELVDDDDLRAACAALPDQAVRRLDVSAAATILPISADEG